MLMHFDSLGISSSTTRVVDHDAVIALDLFWLQLEITFNAYLDHFIESMNSQTEVSISISGHVITCDLVKDDDVLEHFKLTIALHLNELAQVVLAAHDSLEIGMVTDVLDCLGTHRVIKANHCRPEHLRGEESSVPLPSILGHDSAESPRLTIFLALLVDR